MIAYTVGAAEILELPGLETDLANADNPIFTRTLEIGPSLQGLSMRVAPEGSAVCLLKDDEANLVRRDGSILLYVPASGSSRLVKILIAGGDPARCGTTPQRHNPRPR